MPVEMIQMFNRGVETELQAIVALYAKSDWIE
jgi:hypothetical protein